MRSGTPCRWPPASCIAWDPASTYIQEPPFLVDLPARPGPIRPIHGARVLLVLGDSVTTDHISPAGSIPASSPAGHYLQEQGVAPVDFNSYGSRRGNDRVMTRGTFANIRIRNLLAPGTEGGVTRHLPDGQTMTIFEAAMQYKAEGVPLVVLAGEDYGAGSSRDWAAKGTHLLGVRAVLARSFERIHRSNLVGMGVLPLAASRRTNLANPRPDRRGDLRLPRPRRLLAAAGRVDRLGHGRRRLDTDLSGAGAIDVELDYYRTAASSGRLAEAGKNSRGGMKGQGSVQVPLSLRERAGVRGPADCFSDRSLLRYPSPPPLSQRERGE